MVPISKGCQQASVAQRSKPYTAFQDFYLPIDCTDLVFLKFTVAVLHPLGFEILDLKTCAVPFVHQPPEHSRPSPQVFHDYSTTPRGTSLQGSH